MAGRAEGAREGAPRVSDPERRAPRAPSIRHREGGRECDGDSREACETHRVSPWVLIAVGFCGLAAATPLSGEAHEVAAGVLGASPGSGQLYAVAHAAAALVLAIAGLDARRSVPFLPVVVGLMGAEAFHYISATVHASALTCGIGVLATAAMLASTGVAPRVLARQSATRDAVLGAATLSLAGLPGASPVACALTARAWTGRRGPVQGAALAAAPFELRAAVTAWLGASEKAPQGEILAAAAVSLVVAWLGTRSLRLGPERLVRFAVPYLSVLGVSLLAYAWSAR